MQVQAITTTKEEEDLFTTLLQPQALQGNELISKMFLVIHAQNEDLRQEAEKNYAAFQKYQEKLKQGFQSLVQENARLQAELAASNTRYEELNKTHQTEVEASQNLLGSLKEELDTKKEQIAEQKKQIKKLEITHQKLEEQRQQDSVKIGTLEAKAVLFKDREERIQVHEAAFHCITESLKRIENSGVVNLKKTFEYENPYGDGKPYSTSIQTQIGSCRFSIRAAKFGKLLNGPYTIAREFKTGKIVPIYRPILHIPPEEKV
jgi:chromosome segregation ATPase